MSQTARPTATPSTTSTQAAASGAPSSAIDLVASATPNPLAAGIACLVRPGERYAGIMLAADGTLSHHLFLLFGDSQGNWDDAGAWAESVGGSLPTRAEQALLYANLKDQFKRDWYWSGEQYGPSSSHAWGQYFFNGFQDYYLKSFEGRARAVRRSSI